MLKAFKFKQRVFRAPSREKKGLKASAGIQHQLLENRRYRFTNGHWKNDCASNGLSAIAVPAQRAAGKSASRESVSFLSS